MRKNEEPFQMDMVECVHVGKCGIPQLCIEVGNKRELDGFALSFSTVVLLLSQLRTVVWRMCRCCRV